MCSACGKYIGPLSCETLQDITAQGEKLQANCDSSELSFHLSCDVLLQHSSYVHVQFQQSSQACIYIILNMHYEAEAVTCCIIPSTSGSHVQAVYIATPFAPGCKHIATQASPSMQNSVYDCHILLSVDYIVWQLV